MLVGDGYIPVPIMNINNSCPSSTTIQCVAATPLLVASFMSLEAGNSSNEVIRAMNAVLSKVLVREMPNASEVRAMNSALRGLRPVAETAVDIYDDASRYAELIGNAAGK